MGKEEKDQVINTSNPIESELELAKKELSNAYTVIRELISENTELKSRLKVQKEGEGYNPGWSWISKIVFIVAEAQKPLRSLEIISRLQLREPVLDKKNSKEQFVSAFLTQATNYKRLIPFKLKGVRGNFYCLPEWLEEENDLLHELKQKIY